MTISQEQLQGAKDVQAIRTYKEVDGKMIVDGLFIYSGEGLPLCKVDINHIEVVEQ